MEEYYAWVAFVTETGAPLDIRNDYASALDAEITRLKHLSHSDAVEVAAKRILNWWKTAEECKQSPAKLVSNSTLACAWAILARREFDK